MFVILIYRHKGLKEEWKLISEHSQSKQESGTVWRPRKGCGFLFCVAWVEKQSKAPTSALNALSPVEP